MSVLGSLLSDFLTLFFSAPDFFISLISLSPSLSLFPYIYTRVYLFCVTVLQSPSAWLGVPTSFFQHIFRFFWFIVKKWWFLKNVKVTQMMIFYFLFLGNFALFICWCEVTRLPVFGVKNKKKECRKRLIL